MERPKAILLFALLALVEAIQLTVLAAGILHFVPVSSPLAQEVLPEWQALLNPEWETVLFRVFVAAAVGAMIVLMRFGWQRLAALRLFLATESVLLFLLLSAYFKMAVYPPRAQLATVAFQVVLGLLVLNKMFWPWLARAIHAADAFLTRPGNLPFLTGLLTFATPALIFLFLNVPNIPAVVARFFVGEQFHHNDSFIFGGAWAYATGCRLDMDIISQYGIGLGVVFGLIGKLLGGLSYETGFLTRLYGVMIYYVLCFVFLRRWLGSPAIAAAGVLFLIKIQMFHTGVFPFPLTYGSATVLRYWFDIFFLFAIAAHVRRPSLWYIAAAAFACGLQLFYIPSEGVYLTCAYFFYLGVHVLRSQWRQYIGFTWRRLPGWIGLTLMPFAVAVVLLLIFVGPAVLSAQFWQNTREFVIYFLSGFGVTPMYGSLQDRQFLASLMGFVMPSVYVLTLLIVGTLLFLQTIHRRHILVCVLCVYGLAIYHYYVARSAVTSYYVTAMPYAMILSFWAQALICRLSQPAQVRAKLVLAVVCLYALWTNHNFIAYPNAVNFSRNPLTDPLVAQPVGNGRPYFNHLFREYRPDLKVPLNSLGETDEDLVSEADFDSDDALVAYYNKESDFSIDAALIGRLTEPNQPVPLISSFEIKILMQAKRRPYFYYFPLAISRPMRVRCFPRCSIYTTDQLQKTIDGLERDKPPYIFMEKILMTRPLSDTFYFYYSSMIYLTDYVLKNYTPYMQGQYLVAMQRKT